MNTRPQLRSEAAIEEAIEAIGPCNPRTAAVLMFIASARHLAEVLSENPRQASELAYIMADELATRS